MKRLVPLTLAAAMLASSGCHLFSKKRNPSAPRESPTVATDVEKDFMKRWIDKRTAEIVAKGTAPDAARDQAVAEFKVKYSYTEAAQQAK
jgi:ribosomal protein S11